MSGKRINQFNLMLTESELENLKKQAEERGFVNKSQYLRELVKHDAEGENVSQSLMLDMVEDMAAGMHYAMKRYSLLIVGSSLAVLVMTILIYLKI